MTTIRRFCCNDLLRFSSVNLDYFTITTRMTYYMRQLVKFPHYFMVAVAPGNRIMGYLMGEVNGKGDQWHGLVSGVSVGPEYRRQKLATKLVRMYESELLEKMIFGGSVRAYFLRLYVGDTNTPAINFFTKIGYRIFSRLPGFYAEDEDAYDMRKKLVLKDDKEFRSLLG